MLEAVIIYLALSITYFLLKPSLSFREDGTMKPFGLGKDVSPDSTLFPFWLVVILLPVIIFFFYSLLDGWAMPTK
jgi:hypothetical protein